MSQWVFCYIKYIKAFHVNELIEVIWRIVEAKGVKDYEWGCERKTMRQITNSPMPSDQ